MAGTINKKFVFILAGVLVILIGGTAVFIMTVVRKSTSELEAIGDRHLVLAENAEIDLAADPEIIAAAQAQRGQDYRLAAQSYGRAWNRNPQNADILLKYIDARRKMTVRDQYEAKRVLGNVMNLTRRTTELRPNDAQLLEDYYQLIYRWAREFGVPSFYNDLYSLASTRLETDPDNLPALKFRGISQAVQISDSMDRAKQQEIRKDLETVLAARPNDTDVLNYLARWHLYDANRNERAAPGSAAAIEARETAVAYADRMLAADSENPLVKVDYFNVMLAIIDNQRRLGLAAGSEAAREEAIAQYEAGFEKIEPVLDALEAKLLQNPEPSLVVQQVAEILPRVEKQKQAMAARANPDQIVDPNAKPTHLDRTERLLKSASNARPDMLLYRLMLANVLKLQLELDAAHTIYVLARDHPIAGNFESSLRDQALRQQAIYEVANIELIRAEAAQDPERRTQLLADADVAVDELESVTDKDARVLMLRGKIAMLRGETTLAMKFIDQASTLYQDRDIEALLLSARARQAEKQWGAAVQRLERVLDLIRNGTRQDIQSNIRLQLAEMLIRSRKLPEAREQIEYVLNTDGTNIVAKRLLSQWYAAQQQYDEAIAELESLPNTDDPDIARALADLYARSGQDDRGNTLLAEQLENNPSDLRLVQKVLPTLEDADAQRAVLDRAADAGADAQAIRLLRAQIDSRENQEPMTLDDIVQQVTREDASPFDQAIRKAKIYQQYQQYDKARENFEIAKEIDPDHDSVLILAFDLAVRDEKYDQARRLAATAGKRDLDLAEGNFLKGQLAAAEGDLPQALAYYDQALKFRPIFDEGWRQQGDLLLRAGDAYEAVASYNKSLDQKPDNVRTLMGLANAQNQLGQSRDALETLRKAIEYAPNDQNLLDRYLAFEQRYGDPATARRVREDLAESQPNNVQNLLNLATTIANDGDTDDALDILDRVAELQEPNAQLVGTRASILRVSGDVEAGAQVINDYIAQRGDQATSFDYILLARYRLAARQSNESLAAYRQAIELEDKTTRLASRELADVLFNFGQIAPATEIYQDLFDNATDDQRDVLGPRLAESLLRASRGDEAEAVLEKMQDSATTEALRAMLAQQRGKTQDAIDHINRSLGKNNRNPLTYLQRANILAADPDQMNQALDDVQQALSINPDLIEALALQARLQVAMGQSTDATYTLRTLLEKAPGNSNARAQLAQLYLNTDRVDAADDLIAEGLEIEPGNPTWLQLQAGLAASRGDVADAIRSYERLMESQPNPQTLGQLVSLYLQQNQAPQAQALLGEYPELVNTSTQLQAIRGSVLVGLGETDQAKRVFTLALQRSESSAAVSGVIGQMIGSLGEAEAIALAESVDSMPNPAWVDLSLTNLSMSRGDFSGALVRLEKLRGQVPASNEAAHMQIERLAGLAMLQNRDFTGARDAYLRLLEADPDNVEVLNNLAYILADELNDPEAAVPMAEKAAEQAPDNAEILDTLGWTYFQAGRKEDARAALERSVSRRPLPANTLHLGRVYLETGDSRRARPLLQQSVELAVQVGNDEMADQARRYLQQIP